MPSTLEKRRVQQKARRHKRNQHSHYRATLSQETRQRLLTEATNSPAFEGMSADEVSTEVNRLIERYLDKMPAWFGRTASADTRTRAHRRRYLIERGLIAANEQPEHLRRRRLSIEDQIALDEAEASTEASAEASDEVTAAATAAA